MTGNAGVCTDARGSGRCFLRFAVLAIGVLGSLLVLATPALGAPKVDGEFSVSGLGTYNALTGGPDGNMWVTLDAGNDVARITPAGNVQQFNPANLNNPVGITRLGNELWVTQNGGVAKFSPGNPGGAQMFAIAGIGTANDIVVGSDGNLWTASATTVFRINPANPTVGVGMFAVIGTAARGVAAGGDGNIWVANIGGSIVRVTTAGTLPPDSPYVVGGGPQDVAAGPGTQMAFSNPGVGPPHELGRITPGGAPQITKIGTSDPFGITFAADGAYWTARFSTNNIGRMTPNGQFTQLGGFSANAGPRQLAPGPSNTLWVTLQTADKVARVTGVGPEPPAPPDNCTEFELGNAKKNKRRGTAKQTVTVPCAGELALAGKKVKSVTQPVVGLPTGVAAGTGTIETTLTVKPKKKTKRKLKRRGQAKVKFDVTYTPTGGEPNTQDTELKLKKR